MGGDARRDDGDESPKPPLSRTIADRMSSRGKTHGSDDDDDDDDITEMGEYLRSIDRSTYYV